MDTSSFDNEVRRIEQDIAHLRDESEKAYRKCLAEAGAWIVGWSDKQVEEAIKRNPMVVKSQGENRLRALARAVQELKNRLPGLAEALLDSSPMWVHRYTLSDEPGHKMSRVNLAEGYGNRINSELEQQLRELLGHVGGILVEYNLFSRLAGETNDWELRGGDSLPRFRFGFDISQTFRSALLEHDQVTSQFVEKCNERAAVLLAKVEAEARDAWDRAKG